MQNKSFTLIEVLVVIAIIGLLSSIVLVSTQGSREKAKFAKTLQFSRTIQNTLGADAVGWWSFETIEAGKVLDSSGYGHDGTVYGNTSLVAGLEELGNALSLDGSGDYIGCGNIGIPENGPATIEGWFYFTAFANPWGFIVLFTPLYQHPANNYFYIAGTNDYFSVTSILKLNTWHHIVFTYSGDSTTAKVYIDTKEYNDKQQGGNNNITALSNFTISHSSQSFPGFIDEIRVYNQVLSSTEIQKHYVQGLAKHKDLAIK